MVSLNNKSVTGILLASFQLVPAQWALAEHNIEQLITYSHFSSNRLQTVVQTYPRKTSYLKQGELLLKWRLNYTQSNSSSLPPISTEYILCLSAVDTPWETLTPPRFEQDDQRYFDNNTQALQVVGEPITDFVETQSRQTIQVYKWPLGVTGAGSIKVKLGSYEFRPECSGFKHQTGKKHHQMIVSRNKSPEPDQGTPALLPNEDSPELLTVKSRTYGSGHDDGFPPSPPWSAPRAYIDVSSGLAMLTPLSYDTNYPQVVILRRTSGWNETEERVLSLEQWLALITGGFRPTPTALERLFYWQGQVQSTAELIDRLLEEPQSDPIRSSRMLSGVIHFIQSLLFQSFRAQPQTIELFVASPEQWGLPQNAEEFMVQAGSSSDRHQSGRTQRHADERRERRERRRQARPSPYDRSFSDTSGHHRRRPPLRKPESNVVEGWCVRCKNRIGWEEIRKVRKAVDSDTGLICQRCIDKNNAQAFVEYINKFLDKPTLLDEKLNDELFVELSDFFTKRPLNLRSEQLHKVVIFRTIVRFTSGWYLNMSEFLDVVENYLVKVASDTARDVFVSALSCRNFTSVEEITRYMHVYIRHFDTSSTQPVSNSLKELESNLVAAINEHQDRETRSSREHLLTAAISVFKYHNNNANDDEGIRLNCLFQGYMLQGLLDMDTKFGKARRSMSELMAAISDMKIASSEHAVFFRRCRKFLENGSVVLTGGERDIWIRNSWRIYHKYCKSYELEDIFEKQLDTITVYEKTSYDSDLNLKNIRQFKQQFPIVSRGVTLQIEYAEMRAYFLKWKADKSNSARPYLEKAYDLADGASINKTTPAPVVRLIIDVHLTMNRSRRGNAKIMDLLSSGVTLPAPLLVELTTCQAILNLYIYNLDIALKYLAMTIGHDIVSKVFDDAPSVCLRVTEVEGLAPRDQRLNILERFTLRLYKAEMYDVVVTVFTNLLKSGLTPTNLIKTNYIQSLGYKACYTTGYEPTWLAKRDQTEELLDSLQTEPHLYRLAYESFVIGFESIDPEKAKPYFENPPKEDLVPSATIHKMSAVFYQNQALRLLKKHSHKINEVDQHIRKPIAEALKKSAHHAEKAPHHFLLSWRAHISSLYYSNPSVFQSLLSWIPDHKKKKEDYYKEAHGQRPEQQIFFRSTLTSEVQFMYRKLRRGSK